jgi:hypothetical protein
MTLKFMGSPTHASTLRGELKEVRKHFGAGAPVAVEIARPELRQFTRASGRR